MFSFQGTSASFTRICIFRRYAPKNTYFCQSDSTTDCKDYKARYARLVIAQWSLNLNWNFNQRLLKKKWWAKMDSNHRPHDYQSCALASWAIGPYRHFFWWRVPGSNRWPPACKAGALPAELTPQMGFPLFRYIFLYPLNWITHWVTTPCTDLRTLQIRSLSYLRSP